MPKAYSYLRFSTPEQLKGDSARRQSVAAKEYAVKHKLELDDSLTFQDLGVSAFRGKNAKTGALRAFLEAVEAEVVPAGSYLLVESLDRISRAEILAAQGLFLQIVNSGITLVTLMDGRSYSRDSVNANPFDLIASLVIMIRANEESETKAKRGKAVWSAKRAKALDRPLTAMCPAWLKLDKASGKFQEKPEYTKLIRRIFQMALDGLGQEGIAKRLNTEGVPPFTGPTRRGVKHWHRSYIIRMLRNPAVIGTYVPHQYEHPEGKQKRVPLDPITGYYPAVVDQESYDAVQMLLDGKSPQRGRHVAHPLMNLLGGLALCPACDSSMVLVNKGPKSRKKLVCTRAKTGAGCDYRSVDYEQVEEALLDQIHYLLDDCPAQSEEEAVIRAKLTAVEAAKLAALDGIENLVTAVEKGNDSTALRARLQEAEDALEDLKTTESALWSKLTALDRTMIDRKVALLREILDQSTEQGVLDRERINAGLRGLFSNVVIDYRVAELVFRWRHGGHTPVSYGFPDEAGVWERGEDGLLVKIG